MEFPNILPVLTVTHILSCWTSHSSAGSSLQRNTFEIHTNPLSVHSNPVKIFYNWKQMENRMERLLKVNTEIKCRVNTSILCNIIWYWPVSICTLYTTDYTVSVERSLRIIGMFSFADKSLRTKVKMVVGIGESRELIAGSVMTFPIAWAATDSSGPGTELLAAVGDEKNKNWHSATVRSLGNFIQVENKMLASLKYWISETWSHEVHIVT